MNLELEDLLKPPFAWTGDVVKDSADHWILKIDDDFRDTIWSLRYKIQGDLEEALGQFTAQALNEKWERDFGEPMRWKHDGIYTSCPKCLIGHNDKFYPKHYFNYCPYCGQWLLPPKEGE